MLDRAYREKIINKDGVFDAIRQRMWWFHSDARYRTNEQGVRIPCGQLVAGKWKFKATHGSCCPEAGQVLHYQHDGARQHTARVNTQLFRSHGAMKGFNIQVLVQPAQSPDLNGDDLAFFRSLQSDSLLPTKKLKEMKARLDRGAESSASEGDNDDDESSEGESD